MIGFKATVRCIALVMLVGLAHAGESEVVKSETEAETNSPGDISEVVITGTITGTHIPGEAPVGASVKTYSREEVAQSGGTLDEFMRKLSLNFTGADTVSNPYTNIAYARLNEAGVNNGTFGAAPDINGVGPTGTLFLFNGHRVAPGGYNGTINDESQIPKAAIDRVEILPDGASAIYGGDAVAGVVNFVPLRNFAGAESSIRYGSTTGGGASELTASQLIGQSWNGGNVFGVYELNNQHPLDASDRSYIGDMHGPDTLIPRNKRQSGFLSGHQDLAESTSVSADVLYSDRQFFSQTTTYSDIITGSSTFSGTAKTLIANLSLDQGLGFKDWHANLTGSYARMNQDQYSSNDSCCGPFSQHGVAASHVDTYVQSADLVVTGSVFDLPGGPLKGAAGTTYRGEEFQTTDIQTIDPVTNTYALPRVQRHIASGFAEFVVPIVGAANAMPGIARLQLSVAERYDHYSDEGGTTNPHLGLAWGLVDGLTLRGTYGTSFRPASLYQSHGLQSAIAEPIGVQDVIILNGANPNLRPEHSKSYTAGFDFRPTFLPNFSVGGTYTDINFSSRIATPPVAGGNYLDPVAAPFLTLNPSRAMVDAIFASPGFLGDYSGAGPAGVTAIFDNRYQNIATSRVSVLNMFGAYSVEAKVGRYHFSVDATRFLRNDFQPIAGLPSTSVLNTYGEPPHWKGRGSAGWSGYGYTTAVYVNAVGGYNNTLFMPATRVSPWITTDLFLDYDFGTFGHSAAAKGLHVSLSVSNVFDKRPPYAPLPRTLLLPGQNSLPYDGANSSPEGQFIAIEARKLF